MTDYEQDDYDDPPSRHGTANGGSRPGPTAFVLGGLLVGLIAGIALAWVLGGNPFSSTNRVVYTDVIVASVDEEAPRICWPDDPERRDSDQSCAILSIDPQLEVPEPGDNVTIGIADVSSPNGTESRQVVHVEPAAGTVDPAGTETDGTEGADTTGDSAGATTESATP